MRMPCSQEGSSRAATVGAETRGAAAHACTALGLGLGLGLPRLHGGTHGGVAGACGLDAEGLADDGVARARWDEAKRAARDGAVLALQEA